MQPRFPMPMMIRCYDCGKVFDITLRDKEPHDYPCPACGKVETFDLGFWQRKAAAYNAKMMKKFGGGR